MMRFQNILACAVLVLTLVVGRAQAILHAHNDYEHARPLVDALDQGFNSVEADIHLVDGRLLVAHDRHQTRPERTLQALYLEPLRARIRASGGSVLSSAKNFYLLIDVKSDAERTWAVLEKLLAQYGDVFTAFTPARTEPRAVTALISGNRARGSLKGAAPRFAAMDGRLEDLESPEPVGFIPLISADWKQQFAWRGEGAMPDDQKKKLASLVSRAHAQQRMIRFWGTPDLPAVWKELLEAKVDFLNADDLPGLAKFVRKTR